jgi:hypothetical protein
MYREGIPVRLSASFASRYSDRTTVGGSPNARMLNVTFPLPCGSSVCSSIGTSLSVVLLLEIFRAMSCVPPSNARKRSSMSTFVEKNAIGNDDASSIQP